MSKIKPLQADPNWIRARQELLRQVRGEVMRRLGPEPREVQKYSKVYERAFSKTWRESSKHELISEIENSDIVYGGDFHAFSQAQRTHLKVLRALSENREIILALECFSISAQKWLNLYIQGKITLDQLRIKSKWDTEWGFPWENYKPLLEIAFLRQFQIIALNSSERGLPATGKLKAREGRAAKLLAEAHFASPKALIYVVIGDLHVAQEHLPNEVRRLVRGHKIRDLILRLNSEKLYFQLARKALEISVDVVRLGRNQFCILSSPPWVKWQSYLFYLDHPSDRNLEQNDELDPTDHVVRLIRLAANDLGLNFKVDDLAIYASDDQQVWRFIEKSLRPKEREIARQLLSSGRSFFLPGRGIGFLGRSTVNHAAGLAGQYIHARLSRQKRPAWSLPKDFDALIWSEAVSFFISKLINHKRQAETLIDLKAQLTMVEVGNQDNEPMRLSLDKSLSELVYLSGGRRRALRFRPRRRSSYFEASRILGGMMGERLYLAYRSRKLELDDILELVQQDVTSRGFTKLYLEILRRLSTLTIVKSRKERL
jgi:hypothetical protein